MHTKAPAECGSLEEIRVEMDAVDREIVSLIAERVEYVRAAAKFKLSADSISAPERVQAVLDTRREWAESAGLDGSVIERLYRDLVAYCVSEEHKRWHELHS